MYFRRRFLRGTDLFENSGDLRSCAYWLPGTPLTIQFTTRGQMHRRISMSRLHPGGPSL